MATRERLRDRGTRRAGATLRALGEELRHARLALGLRQVDVARAAGISPSWISRIELGQARDVGYRPLCVVFAIVGLDLSTRAYAGGDALRDDGHHGLLGRTHRALPAEAPWDEEVLLPGPGEQRAWDARTRLWGRAVGIEAEMRPTDLQAMQRRLRLKKRDGGVDRMIVALADTRGNRDFLRAAGDSLRAMFPRRVVLRWQRCARRRTPDVTCCS
jgi:transcriptional regulator with XRE-family HTH domain